MQAWTIRKANVWWLANRERGEEAGIYLKYALSPESLIK
jgi:phosphohistidine phosphatase